MVQWQLSGKLFATIFYEFLVEINSLFLSVCLSICLPAMSCRPIQGVACLSPFDSWDGSPADPCNPYVNKTCSDDDDDDAKSYFCSYCSHMWLLCDSDVLMQVFHIIQKVLSLLSVSSWCVVMMMMRQGKDILSSPVDMIILHIKAKMQKDAKKHFLVIMHLSQCVCSLMIVAIFCS